jgi:hypothetical protein
MKLYGAPSSLRAYDSRNGLYTTSIGLGLFTLIDYDVDDVITVFIGNYFPCSVGSQVSIRNSGYIVKISNRVIMDCYSTKGWLCMASLSNSASRCFNTKTGKVAKANAFIHMDKRLRVTLRAVTPIKKYDEVICSYTIDPQEYDDSGSEDTIVSI